MADLKDSFEKLKAEYGPVLANLFTEAGPYLKQLRSRALERWLAIPEKEKRKLITAMAGAILIVAVGAWFYRHSKYFARLQLMKMGYELSAADLTKACLQTDLIALDYFMQSKWSVDSKFESGLTPLMIVAEQGQTNCVLDLIARGANPNLKDERGESAIIRAIRSRSFETVQALLAVKPELNYLSKNRQTSPLHTAIDATNSHILHALLDAGADPNVKNAEKKTPLFAAALAEPAILTLLLEKKADPNIVDPQGTSPLVMAIGGHKRENVAVLLKAGAKPDPLETGALSPLHAAIDENFLDVVDDLLAAGANPNLPNAAGLTPLIRAVALADERLVSALLARGADANLRIKMATPEPEEYAPLDMAYFVRREGIEKIEALLKAKGGRAVISWTVRAGTRDWESMKLIEKIQTSSQFVRGRIVDMKNWDEFPVVRDLLSVVDIPFERLFLINVGGPALLATTDSSFAINSMFTAKALKWGSAQTSLGMIPVYIENTRNGKLRGLYAEILKRSYSRFLHEWPDRLPAAYELAQRLKTAGASALDIDDLTMLSALLFGPENFGKATQVYQAARAATLCQIERHSSLPEAKWRAEIEKILATLAKSAPELLLSGSTVKDRDQRKSAVAADACASKSAMKTSAGDDITFTQCMCGSHAAAPVPPPTPETLRDLAQMVNDNRVKLESQTLREPSSKK